MMRRITALFFFLGVYVLGFAENTRGREYILVLSRLISMRLGRIIYTKIFWMNSRRRGFMLRQKVVYSNDDEDRRGGRKEGIFVVSILKPPKVVVFIGDPAWLVCQPLFDKEWKDIPTVICYSRDSMPRNLENFVNKDFLGEGKFVLTEVATAGYNLTVIKQPFYVKNTIDLIRRLQPEVKK